MKSFGCNDAIAEDLVQEMYIKIIIKVKKGLDIRYNETEINYYYIFRTLNSLFIDLTRIVSYHMSLFLKLFNKKIRFDKYYK